MEGLTNITSDYNGFDISCFDADDASFEGIVNGGSPNYEYQWFDDLGNQVGNNQVIQNAGPGIYTVKVTDINGCTLFMDVIIEEPTPVEVNINILTDYFGLPVSCIGAEDGAVEAIGSGGASGYEFEWNTNPVVQNFQLINVGVGVYTVTMTDMNGCEIEASVTLEGNPVPDILVSPPQEVCEDEIVFISSETFPGYDCVWTFSEGTTINECGGFEYIFDPVGCIDADIVITTPEGCISEMSYQDYICVYPNPISAFTQSDLTVSNVETGIQFFNESQGAISYIWNFGDEESSTSYSPYHEFPFFEEGDYIISLIAISDFGCTDTSYSSLNVYEDLILYVPNTFTPDDDEFNQYFTPVLASGYNPYTYEFLIFNRWGELIFETDIIGLGWDGKYNDNAVKDGTYIWKIRVSNKYDAERHEFVGHVNVLR